MAAAYFEIRLFALYFRLIPLVRTSWAFDRASSSLSPPETSTFKGGRTNPEPSSSYKTFFSELLWLERRDRISLIYTLISFLALVWRDLCHKRGSS